MDEAQAEAISRQERPGEWLLIDNVLFSNSLQPMTLTQAFVSRLYERRRQLIAVALSRTDTKEA